MKKPLLLLCLILTACSHPSTAYLPVPTPCNRETAPPEPRYPVANLRQGDKPSAVAKAYVGTVRLQQGYIKELKMRGFNNG